MDAQNPDNEARLSRDPSKNSFLSEILEHYLGVDDGTNFRDNREIIVLAGIRPIFFDLSPMTRTRNLEVRVLARRAGVLTYGLQR